MSVNIKRSGFMAPSMVLTLMLVATTGMAQEACTWDEALMAWENNNTVRGLALMRMAARDGDERAVRYLVKIGDQDVNPVISNFLIAGQTPAGPEMATPN